MNAGQQSGETRWRKQVFLLACETLGVFSLCICGLRLVQFAFSRILFTAWSKDKFVLVALHAGLNVLMWTVIGLWIAMMVWGVRRWRDGWTAKDLGFRFSHSWRRDLWTGVVGFGLLYLASLPVLLAVFPSKAASASGVWLKNLFNPAYPLLLYVAAWVLRLTGVFLSSFWEEIYFRGYFQGLTTKVISPASAFWATLLFFSLGHYFTRPTWQFLDVLNSFIATVVFCALYYASGSLVAASVAHTLANAWWDYPFALYMQKDFGGARQFLLLLGAACGVLAVAGWKEVAAVLRSLAQIATQAGWRNTALGFLLGASCLLYQWGLSVAAKSLGRWGSMAALLAFGVAAISVSHFAGRRFTGDASSASH